MRARALALRGLAEDLQTRLYADAPRLIGAKDAAAQVIEETLPEGAGKVELTVDQADAWLAALNDVRLALGTALDVS